MRIRTYCRRAVSLVCAAGLIITGAWKVAAYADTASGSSSGAMIGSVADAYGWDTQSLSSSKWTGINNQTYSRDSDDYYAYDYYTDSLEMVAEEAGIDLTSMDFGSIGASIASVALEEAESDDNAEDPMGSNMTKYGEWYGSNGLAWCAIFVSYCADKCGLLDTDDNPFGIFPKAAGVGYYHSYFIHEQGFKSYDAFNISQFGGSEYDAVVGDIFFFRGEDDQYGHIGIITEVTDSSITVTQGNTGDRVLSLTYSIKNVTGRYDVYNGSVVHVEYPSQEYTVFRFLVHTMELTPAAACGVLANMRSESGLCSARVEGDFTDGYTISWNYVDEVDSDIISEEDFCNDQKGFGLCQWTFFSRKEKLYAICEEYGMSIASIDCQLVLLQQELENGYRDSVLEPLQALGNTEEDAYEAAKIWCVAFEKPQNAQITQYKRADMAVSDFWPVYCDYEYVN